MHTITSINSTDDRANKLAYAPSALFGNGLNSHPTVREIERSRCEVLRYLLKLKLAIDANHSDLIDTLTNRFVEAITDYVSYGHFRLLTKFDPARHLSAAMDQNTKSILSLIETHMSGGSASASSLTIDLESLAFQIEARFDIEDEIVYH